MNNENVSYFAQWFFEKFIKRRFHPQRRRFNALLHKIELLEKSLQISKLSSF